jgi:hypothetical protein
MAIQLEDNIDIIELLEILKEDFVISKKSSYFDHKTQSNKYSSNMVQFYIEDNDILRIKFDSYGNKIETKISNKDVMIEDLISYKSNNKIFKHKKRISKKSKNNNIVDEKDSKKLIYTWLLKKHTDAIIIPEVALGDRRVDYLALDANITSIEIKSEVDTVERLEEQIKQYLKYSNYVYIAAHTSKIEKIKKMNIPDLVGLIEITSTKLKFLKKAKKQKIDYAVFKSFISYNEYLEMKRGFKGSSKIEKMDMELLFDKIISKKKQSEYISYIMKQRYSNESNIRKKAFENNEIDKALGAAKNIGINRMTNSVCLSGIKHYFDLSETLLTEYIINERKKIYKLYKDFKYKDLLIEDRLFYLKTIQLLEIPYIHDNSKILKYDLLSRYKDIIMNNQAKIINTLLTINENKLLEVFENINHIIIDIRSKEAKDYIENKLKEWNINIVDIKMKSNIIDIPQDLDKDKKTALLLINKSGSFYFSREIEKIILFTLV